MAAETRRDVELHIRARNYSNKTVDEVTSSLKELTRQQEEQLASAKRGESSLKSLEAAYGRLESAGRALLQQNAIVETFNAQSEALAKLRTRLSEARSAQQSYATEMAKVENPTKAQVRELNRLTAAVNAAERAQTSAEGRISRTEQRMAKYGITADNAAQSQARIAAAVGEVNKALEAQDKAIDSLDGDMRAAREREAFEKTRAENIRRMREAEVNSVWQVALAERDAVEQARAGESRRRDELRQSGEALDKLVSQYDRVAAAAIGSMATGERRQTGNADQDLRNAEEVYRRQIEVVREAREAYRLTREQARQFAEQLRSGAAVGQDAEARQAWFNKTLEEGAADLQNATRVARANRAEVEKATAAVQKEAAARDAQRAAALRAADDADKLRRSYAELARAGDSQSMQNLQQSIRNIINPSAEAAKTLAGLETSVDALSKKVESIKGPVKDYRSTLEGLTAAMRTATSIAGQIDGYRSQLEAVMAARQEYTSAREAARLLAEQMRASGAPTTEMTQNLTAAQTRLRQAAQEMQRTTERAREMRQGLRDAGVDTRNLEAAEASLTAQAGRLNTAMTGLTDAYEKNGAAADNAGKKMNGWFGSGRTTLSYFQRMRGELLGMAAGFVGIQAAVNGASSALEAYRSKQAIESRIAVAVGNDAKLIKAEWDYLMGQANRLGFGFEDMAMSYSKFAVAAKAGGSTNEEVRFIFEKIAEGARVAKMSTDDFNGSLKAIEQMMSKGQITAEELRQQLGDRLPGAMALAAKGAGYTVQEFNKLMEQGQISSAFVINLARELGTSVADRLDESLKSLSAIEGRMQTAQYEFRLALAENGFVDAYSDFIEKLTKLMQSDEGRELAENLSVAFRAVVNALSWAADNVDTLAIAFGAMLAVNVVGWLINLHRMVMTVVSGIGVLVPTLVTASGLFTTTAASAGTMTAAVGTSAAAVGGLTGAMGGLIAAFKVLARFIPVVGTAIAVAWAGYDLYKHMSDGEADAAKAGGEAGKAYGDAAAAAAATAASPDPLTGGTTDTATLAGIRKTLATADERTRKADVQSRLRQDKKDMQARLDIVSEEYEMMKTQARANVKDEAERAKVIEEIEKGRLARIAVERRNFETEQARAAASAGGKRVSLARQVADELQKIEDNLEKSSTSQDVGASFDDRLRTRLAAVSHEYDKLRQRIDALAKTDKVAAAQASSRLDTYIKTRQEIEEHKVRQEELKRLEERTNEQVSARAAMIANVNAEFAAGLISQEEMRRRVEEITRSMTEGVQQAGAKLREFAATMKAVLTPAAYQELMARVDTQMLQNDPETVTTGAQLEISEQRINDLLDQRNAILDTIDAKRKQGLIDDALAAQEQDEANGRFRESILAAATEVESLAAAFRNPENAAAMDVLIEKMKQIRMETEGTKVAFTALDTTIVNSMTNNALTAIDAVAQSLANVVAGQESMGDAFRAAGVAAAQFFAQLMRDIAMAIIRQQILNMLSRMGGPIGSAATQLGGVGISHNGGVVGSAGTAGLSRTRNVAPALFNNAPRMHTGGVVGLSRDEVPRILQVGEEVLAKDDPRNIMNGGGMGASGGAGSVDFKAVIVDDPDRVAEQMAGKAGQRVIMATLRQNAAEFKSIMR